MNDKLVQARKKLRLTQREVAEKVGISENTYQQYEYGKIVPSVLIAIKISDMLKTPIKGLWGD